ncbi:DUF6266 family protein [Formosa algae]|uniref:DUF6266 family protein n=1 Tax=Formosa algae TaxID=225843 RepID=UPI000CCEA533|nr:DUF6266 family protein [Formosa algae]PNW27870.1 hypothetical protein BKP44_10580 [Formosa algae]
MATLHQGILGGFSGKVGPVIGSKYRGKNILRSVPTKSTKPISAAQQRQRDKFKMVLQFLTPIKVLLNDTFGKQVGSKSPYNQAMSYHMREAVKQMPTGFTMDYAKVLVGMGGLCGIEQPTVQTTPAHTLHITWDDNSTQGMAYPTDAFLAVVYAPALQQFDYVTGQSERVNEQDVLAIPERFYGETVHVWATFTNSDLDLTATSKYLGDYVV